MSTRHWRGLQRGLATLIAVLAIGLAAWEGLENRRHNRLSVAPRLDGSFRLSRENAALVLQSNGLGPAVIEDFRIYFDGELRHDARDASALVSPWEAIMSSLEIQHVTVEANALGAGTLLRPNQDYELFSAAARDTTQVKGADLARLLESIAVEVCYCSIYNDQCRRTYVGTKDVNTKGCRRS